MPADKPYEWSDLVEIIRHKKGDLSLLSRSADQERVYTRYRERLRVRWRSVYDYVLVGKFQFEKRPFVLDETVASASAAADADADGDCDENDNDALPPPGILWKAHPPLSEYNRTRTCLCLNDFPYYFVPGIEHWCLWKIGGEVNDAEINDAKERLIEMGRSGAEDENGEVLATLHWVNPPHLKSLPDIDHAHILCLRKQLGDAHGQNAATCNPANDECISPSRH